MKAIVALTVNGDRHEIAVPEHWTLLETLRYGLGLTGSKQGCDKGDCGACTVLLDGLPVLACITPVWEAEGRAVTTVEGLAGPGALHPLQQAFAEAGAAQCGFCTPGILMSAWGLLLRDPVPGRDDIAEAISGNLCRCTGYTKIVEAIEMAAGKLESGRAGEREGVSSSAISTPSAAAPTHPMGVPQSVSGSERQGVSSSAASDSASSGQSVSVSECQSVSHPASSGSRAGALGAPGVHSERPDAHEDANADAGAPEGRGRPDSRSHAVPLSRSPE